MIFKDLGGPQKMQDRLARLRRFLPPTEAKRLLTKIELLTPRQITRLREMIRRVRKVRGLAS